jgi:hypothetical protein
MSMTISKFEKCPNCSEPRHLDIKECPYCGVIYDKVIPKDMMSGPQANVDIELLQYWQELVADYSNKEKHELFLQRALAKKRLPFASQQYRKLLELNPSDALAKSMQEKILNLASVVMMQQKRVVDKPKGVGISNMLVILGVGILCMGFVFKQNFMIPSILLIATGISAKVFFKNRFSE